MDQILPGITNDLTCQPWTDLDLISSLAMAEPVVPVHGSTIAKK